jgi:crossover junction endodeoxyribonuclease RusA
VNGLKTAGFVTLGWPATILSPNARAHFHDVAKAKKAYRTACWALTRQAGIRLRADASPHLVLTFVPPDRRARDLDNMLASIKAGLDGVADAIGCDDSRWTLTLKREAAVGGMVRVEVLL